MMHYDAGPYQCLICPFLSLEGSVIPKALLWSVPSALISALIRTYLYGELGLISGQNLTKPEEYNSISGLWAGYTFMVMFLLTFRTQKAYSRWWEGGTLLQQARGEWINAFSSVISFCSKDANKYAEVSTLKQTLATLTSTLYATSLQMIAQSDMELEVLNLTKLTPECEEFWASTTDRTEVVMLWIQNAVVEGFNKGVINVPAPVVTRVFQELSRGIVNINNVRKIAEFLFPYPYAQLLSVMIWVHAIITPAVAGLLLPQWYWAPTLTFTAVFSMTSLNLVAAEIERPFGDDANDLPMGGMMKFMNRTLLMILSAPLPTFEEMQAASEPEPELSVSTESELKDFTRESVVKGFLVRSKTTERMTDHVDVFSHMVGKQKSCGEAEKRGKVSIDDVAFDDDMDEVSMRRKLKFCFHKHKRTASTFHKSTTFGSDITWVGDRPEDKLSVGVLGPARPGVPQGSGRQPVNPPDDCDRTENVSAADASNKAVKKCTLDLSMVGEDEAYELTV